MALSLRNSSSLANRRPSGARTAPVTASGAARARTVVVRAAAEPVTAVASRRAALAMGVCGALLSAAPAWSKEQQVPADDMPAGPASTVKAVVRPAAMQQTAGSGPPPVVYVGRGSGGKGGTR